MAPVRSVIDQPFKPFAKTSWRAEREKEREKERERERKQKEKERERK
jgi:hypothetical protein